MWWYEFLREKAGYVTKTPDIYHKNICTYKANPPPFVTMRTESKLFQIGSSQVIFHPDFYPGKDWRICIIYWRAPIHYLIIQKLERNKVMLYGLKFPPADLVADTLNNWWLPACWLCLIITIHRRSHRPPYLSAGLWWHTCSINDHVILKYKSPALDCRIFA